MDYDDHGVMDYDDHGMDYDDHGDYDDHDEDHGDHGDDHDDMGGDHGDEHMGHLHAAFHDGDEFIIEWSGLNLAAGFVVCFASCYALAVLAGFAKPYIAGGGYSAKAFWSAVLSVPLGLGAIFSPHFIALASMHFLDDEGAEFELYFYVDYTIWSAVGVYLCSCVGFFISMHDHFFAAFSAPDRLYADIKEANWSIRAVRQKNAFKRVAFFASMQHLVVGGAVAATGALFMHYQGMMSMEIHNTVELDAGGVVGACVIALIAGTGAFWIIFRMLVWMPMFELRIGGALLMSLGVLGSHITAMASVTFRYSEDHHFPHGLLAREDVVPVCAMGALIAVTASTAVVAEAFLCDAKKASKTTPAKAKTTPETTSPTSENTNVAASAKRRASEPAWLVPSGATLAAPASATQDTSDTTSPNRRVLSQAV